MKPQPSARDVVLSTFLQRRHYIDNSCRDLAHVGQRSSSTNPDPPVVGRSLFGNPTRAVVWCGHMVEMDYRKVEIYDTALASSGPKSIWSAVSIILNLQRDPRKDGVPYEVRRHLFSANKHLEELLFETWYQQSAVWTPKRVGAKVRQQHLFAVD
jgi:hypothetical protein